MIHTQHFDNKTNYSAVLKNYAPVYVKVPENYKGTENCVKYLSLLCKIEFRMHEITELGLKRGLDIFHIHELSILFEQRQYIVEKVETSQPFKEYKRPTNEFDNLIASMMMLRYLHFKEYLATLAKGN